MRSGDRLPVEQATERLFAAAAEAEAVGVSDLVAGLRGDDHSLLVRAARLIAAGLAARGRDYPIALSVIPRSSVDAPSTGDACVQLPETGGNLPLNPAIALGSLLVDGIGDLVQVEPGGCFPDEAAGVRLAYDCLQAAGARTFRAELIACPSCGRTLFDLQSTTERIKAKTGHLVGVRIAVMGCVVNGPGELADADFGYMGGAPGRVNLYVGRECVEKNVPAEEADERLIALIKAHGRWVHPSG